jgi:hypothetical protein
MNDGIALCAIPHPQSFGEPSGYLSCDALEQAWVTVDSPALRTVAKALGDGSAPAEVAVRLWRGGDWQPVCAVVDDVRVDA